MKLREIPSSDKTQTKLKKWLEYGRDTALDLIYPRRCPVCDEPVRPWGGLICDRCQDQLEALDSLPTCPICGKVLPEAGLVTCADCQKRQHRFDRNCAAFSFRSVSGSLYRLKYEGRAEYADYLGRKMADRVLAVYGPHPADLVIPVPSSPERFARRGYNQSALLARTLASALGIPEREDILRRPKTTQVLRNMSVSDRYKNLKNAFIVYSDDVKLSAIMLVDDIYTTGATLDACADLLRGAGAASVYCATLAIGESPS